MPTLQIHSVESVNVVTTNKVIRCNSKRKSKTECFINCLQQLIWYLRENKFCPQPTSGGSNKLSSLRSKLC
jgi:hypothetical protein